MRLLVVTGMSGAGKSKVIDALEDLGYFCVDNLPPRLAPTFATLITGASEPRELAAVVMDARAGDSFSGLVWALDKLTEDNVPYKVVFLDASDDVLRRRYKETRRQHPLCAQRPELGLSGAIAAERTMLLPLRGRADYYFDTSDLSPTECKNRVIELFSEEGSTDMHIHMMSFGFKHGAPRDADLLFDVRCLPNPFYIPELKTHSGLEFVIEDYVFSFDESRAYFDKMLDLLLFSLPLYQKEGKSALTVAFGCTGGMHRSVLFARRTGEELLKRGYSVHLEHRDLLLQP